MNIEEYQSSSMETAVYKNIGENPFYPMKGLIGEFGELVEKVKKIERDDNSILTDDKKTQLIKEAGDVLWYLSSLCGELKIRLVNLIPLDVNSFDDLKIFMDIIQFNQDRNDINGIIFRMSHNIGTLASLLVGLDAKANLFNNDIFEEMQLHLTNIILLLYSFCEFFNIKLSHVAQINIDKLKDRHKRGVVSGSGDNR